MRLSVNYDKFVKCPFYLKIKSLGLHCEAISPGALSTVTYFDEVNELKRFVKENCNRDYKQCKLYKALIDKWE